MSQHRVFHHKSAPGLENLWIITTVSNSSRYRSRYELYHTFKAAMDKAGVNLMVVELALGDRPFEVTEPGNPNHVQLRTWDELWHKENMLNIAISRLPSNWEYVAWVDADIEFMRQDWPQEIVHQLQRYQICQLFQNAIDLGPNGEVMQTYDGFAWAYITKQPPSYSQKGKYGQPSYPHWHPGFAWSFRREAIDALGGLLDIGVLGASDHHMACALIGKGIENTPKEVSDNYKQHIQTWQNRAMKHIRQDFGYMPGTIYHHFHGRKRDRRYGERWQIIIDNKFVPDVDLKKDWQGLYTFTDEGERMRNDIRGYFTARNEDSIDLD